MIAIKGMTMPKSCGDCPLFHDELIYMNCNLTGMELMYPQFHEGRDKTCPLIELDRRLEHEINVYQYERTLEKKNERDSSKIQ